jgi:hypothetical protein
VHFSNVDLDLSAGSHVMLAGVGEMWKEIILLPWLNIVEALHRNECLFAILPVSAISESIGWRERTELHSRMTWKSLLQFHPIEWQS